MMTRNLRSNLKFVSVALLALLFIALYPSTNAFANKKAKYGVMKILTSPGGLLLTIDGKAHGETLTDFREFTLEPGVHSVVVRLPNGTLWTREIEVNAGRIKCVKVDYKPLPPAPKSPCPFPVNISAPQNVAEGEIITFAADVNYSGDTPGLKYKWVLSPATGRIMSGAGSATVTVDSTGLGGQRVIATVTVDNGSPDPACAQTAQAVAVVAPIEKKVLVAREFDECDSCTFDDQKARLDNLAVELQNDPSVHAHIIAYGGRRSPIGQVEKLMSRAREYLVNERGIDGSRIVVVNGGFREGDSVELWLVPAGATAPRATPTVQAGDIKPVGPARRRRG